MPPLTRVGPLYPMSPKVFTSPKFFLWSSDAWKWSEKHGGRMWLTNTLFLPTSVAHYQRHESDAPSHKPIHSQDRQAKDVIGESELITCQNSTPCDNPDSFIPVSATPIYMRLWELFQNHYVNMTTDNKAYCIHKCQKRLSLLCICQNVGLICVSRVADICKTEQKTCPFRCNDECR